MATKYSGWFLVIDVPFIMFIIIFRSLGRPSRVHYYMGKKLDEDL